MYVNTIGIIVRQWAISSRWQWPTNPQLSEASAWLAAQWPVAMTTVGRLKLLASPPMDAVTLAVLFTALRGECVGKWDTAGLLPTYCPMSQAQVSRLRAGNAWASEEVEAGRAKADRE